MKIYPKIKRKTPLFKKPIQAGKYYLKRFKRNKNAEEIRRYFKTKHTNFMWHCFDSLLNNDRKWPLLLAPRSLIRKLFSKQ